MEIIRRNGWRNVLVLTDDFHLTRAKFCFHALGQPVSMEKVSNPMTGIILFYWIRELVARLIYPRQVRAYQGRW
ncbi:MAG: hypothetical protein CBB68_12765 [Rhodospirillaceae bacterium TMED8]|nr:hypothetical protein [Magnetovibrio sp.]OUT48978.1 MAG: hypothetical protein CBB68_12765 [Rhodospirillaceae bacterium TMED8]